MSPSGRLRTRPLGEGSGRDGSSAGMGGLGAVGAAWGLTARMKAQMVSTRARMRADRAMPLVAVAVSGGVLVYTVLNNAVFRQHMESDQTVALTEGTSQVDGLVELPLTDPVTGAVITPTAIAYLAVTGTATAGAVAVASKYEILSYKKGGMAPNRWVCQLRRLR